MAVITIVQQAATRVYSAASYDPYTPIHRGLRLALFTLLTRIGTADVESPAAKSGLIRAIRAQLAPSSAYLAREDEHIRQALEGRAPGVCATRRHLGQRHRASAARIGDLLTALEAADTLARPALERDLCLQFTAFVAEMVAHMHAVETVMLPLLQRLFTDHELMAIERRNLAAIPATELTMFLRITVPAMDTDEQAHLLSLVKATVPAETFAAMVEGAVRPALIPADWQDLAVQLGLGAAPKPASAAANPRPAL